MKIRMNISQSAKDKFAFYFTKHGFSTLILSLMTLLATVAFIIDKKLFGYAAFWEPDTLEKFSLFIEIVSAVYWIGCPLWAAMLLCETVFDESKKKKYLGYLLGAILAMGFAAFTNLQIVSRIWGETGRLIKGILEILGRCYIFVLLLLVVFYKFRRWGGNFAEYLVKVVAGCLKLLVKFFIAVLGFTISYKLVCLLLGFHEVIPDIFMLATILLLGFYLIPGGILVLSDPQKM